VHCALLFGLLLRDLHGVLRLGLLLRSQHGVLLFGLLLRDLYGMLHFGLPDAVALREDGLFEGGELGRRNLRLLVLHHILLSSLLARLEAVHVRLALRTPENALPTKLY